MLLSKSQVHCKLELTSCHGLRKVYMAEHALRQWDAGACISEIAKEMGSEIKFAQRLLDAADYWRERLDG
ncbi:hypothetical protein AAFO90_21850 [Phaeobacter sp. CAU 1743]